MDAMTRVRVSLEDYLALPETLQRMEYHDGEIVEMPAPTIEHQDLAGLIYARLLLGKPGRAFISPVDVVINEFTVVQPDVIWLKPGTACMVETKRLRGVPDLVVEVLSPDSVRRDRGMKFRLYQQSGVAEYWIVSPDDAYIEVWSLSGSNYSQVGNFGPGETLTSPLLGELPLGDLFAARA